MSEPRPRRILPIIVLAQFCGTSLWFAGNAASADLGMGDSVAYVASAVQLGFIVGTLCSAWLRIADRYAASRLFFGSCLLGAACNYPLTMLALATLPQPDAAVLILRFLVGVALAGIYPVGIRAAASWFQAGLGHRIGLHFDCGYYGISSVAQLEDMLAMEARLLERVFGQRIDVFSFHNPDAWMLQQREVRYAGLLNTYSEFFRDQVGYCSDSNGYWRHRRLADVLEQAADHSLQVLTHPGWWVDEPMSP
ncbi:hypothetical protein AZ18_4488, partial [Bordetella bronchiseptica D993]